MCPGDYLCSNLKPEITALNSRVHSRRAAFAKINAASAKQRAKLERGLASALFQVRDAFPRPEDEEEKAKQVVNMRGKLLRVEKQGYLYKQSTSLKKDWKRRWFALQEGQLFYFRSSQVGQFVCGSRVGTLAFNVCGLCLLCVLSDMLFWVCRTWSRSMSSMLYCAVCVLRTRTA